MEESRSVVAVFLQHRASLIEYAAARAGREHAEDVVQEAFVRLSTIQTEDADWAYGPRGEIRNLNSYLVHSIFKCDMPMISMVSLWRFWHVPMLFAAHPIRSPPSVSVKGTQAADW